MSAPERAVVWLRLQRGGRRAVEVAIDPAEVDRALAKWQRLLGSTRPLEVNLYPARADAGPPNPVFGLPDLHGDPVEAVAGHLVDQHGLGGDTTSWLRAHEGLVGLVGEHDLDHTEHHAGQQLGHIPPHGDQPRRHAGRDRQAGRGARCSFRSPTQPPIQ